MKICIDPGHGGTDPGAVGNGYYEKDLTLSISLLLQNYLIENGIEVFMTRTNDETLDATPRITRVNSFKPDICISVHINAGGGSGAETIVQINNENSKKLGETILDQLGELGFKKRRVFTKASTKNAKQDYYFMLRRTVPINSVIVECLFIDNSSDIKFMQEIGLDKIAAAIGIGLLDYLGIKPKEQEHWAKKYLDNLSQLGLTNGIHNPDDIPTWGELSAMITRTINYIKSEGKQVE